MVSAAILIFALFFWGVERYAGDTDVYVTYFNQDVSGLSKDTPVKYRGVDVGRITDVRLAPDGELIEVLMSLRSNFKVTTQQVTRIVSAGITGMKYLGIGISKTPTNDIQLSFFPEYPLINSRPSPGITDLIVEFQKKMKEILALYLNQIYYGGLAYGIEAASQTYFAKPAKTNLVPTV